MTPAVSWAANREILAAIYPLHINLVTVLHSFTTTSLLPAELQLFSISLINLLTLAESPQMKIASIILWVGGLGIVVLCSDVLRWGVALARVPRWRLRRAGRIVQARQSFIKALNEGLQRKDARKKKEDIVESDADDDGITHRVKVERLGLDDLKKEVLSALHNFFPLQNDESLSAFEDHPSRKTSLRGSSTSANGRRRRNTLPAKTATAPEADSQSKDIRQRSKTAKTSFFVSLTPTQAFLRKWLYAGYIYFIIAFLILVPIRIVISRTALDGAEPFGWAIGYLFGNLQRLRFWVVTNSLLESWIRLPQLHERWRTTNQPLGLAAHYTNSVGRANTRLLLVLYSAFTLISGLLTVLSLPASVEVDTRRKVFHGTMVAMLLPSIYFDPPFFSLALAIVLACFCLLDLLRASQLPPLSKPLANFLAPFVDGRDNRGPVVISHIFLLVGCAVPLWLSLAASQLTGDVPWRGWDADARHVSLVSGVVCVGMGDAAASLVGRRFGRRKLPWAGGKSLEGSAAFALAVVLGLVFAKTWLWLGQWNDEVSVPRWGFGPLFAKSSIAAVGASLMEAVLTGGNDNVVVPVILWVLVRALRI
jgi:dolichol kinase